MWNPAAIVIKAEGLFRVWIRRKVTLGADVVHYVVLPSFPPIHCTDARSALDQVQAGARPLWHIHHRLALGGQVVIEWSCQFTSAVTPRRVHELRACVVRGALEPHRGSARVFHCRSERTRGADDFSRMPTVAILWSDGRRDYARGCLRSHCPALVADSLASRKALILFLSMSAVPVSTKAGMGAKLFLDQSASRRGSLL